MSDVLALIPARGGSKGIPRKNVMPIAGKPLIAWSILHARASKRITRVIVSTDDAEIADVSKAWGAEVPFVRPAEFAEDLSPDIDVFRHALEWLRREEDYAPEAVVHLRPPGPARRVERIDEAISLLLAHPEADAVRSVSPALQTPYKMWTLRKDGFMEPIARAADMVDSASMPRQVLPMVWWQCGYVDVLRPRAVLDKDSMWGDHVLPFFIEERLLEIDYPENVPDVEEALRRLEAGQVEPVSIRDERHPV